MCAIASVVRGWNDSKWMELVSVEGGEDVREGCHEMQSVGLVWREEMMKYCRRGERTRDKWLQGENETRERRCGAGRDGDRGNFIKLNLRCVLGASVVAAVGDITADRSADQHSRKTQSVLPQIYVSSLKQLNLLVQLCIWSWHHAIYTVFEAYI